MSRDVNNFISTSTNFIEQPIPLNYFPNPATHSFQLAFDKTNQQDWSFTLLDNLGRMVYQQMIIAPTGKVSIPINLNTDIESGLYHFVIRNAQGLGVASNKIILRNEK